MSHNYRFGPPSGGKGWPQFDKDGRRIREAEATEEPGKPAQPPRVERRPRKAAGK